MQVILIRHGIAQDGEAFAKTGKPDEKRPLTPRGRRRLRRAAVGLARVVPSLDALLSSPLTRARQSAEVIAQAFDGVDPEVHDALRPGGDREAILGWLTEQGESDSVAIVGHEPDLGLLASWLFASPLNHFVELKKGGAVCLGWSGRPAPGNGWLRWALTPGQLRRLAG